MHNPQVSSNSLFLSSFLQSQQKNSDSSYFVPSGMKPDTRSLNQFSDFQIPLFSNPLLSDTSQNTNMFSSGYLPIQSAFETLPGNQLIFSQQDPVFHETDFFSSLNRKNEEIRKVPEQSPTLKRKKVFANSFLLNDSLSTLNPTGLILDINSKQRSQNSLAINTSLLSPDLHPSRERRSKTPSPKMKKEKLDQQIVFQESKAIFQNPTSFLQINEYGIPFSPSSPSDSFGLSLAQIIFEITILPQKRKSVDQEVVDLDNETFDDFQQANNYVLGNSVQYPITKKNSNEISHLARMILSKAYPTPLSSLISGLLMTAQSRSSGIPTNVNVPDDGTVDKKTLKRLRNRVSASRCRMKKKLTYQTITTCSVALNHLISELETYVQQLKDEKDGLLKHLIINTKNQFRK